MRSKEVNRLLADRGFKYSERLGGDPDYIIANYFRLAYDSDAPLCLCNEKPPQIWVAESYIKGLSYHTFSVAIRNEAPQGWIDFKFYALTDKDILERFDEIESALLNAWKGLFSPAPFESAERELTDAEVDAILEQHKDVPINDDQIERVRKMYKEKLSLESKEA